MAAPAKKSFLDVLDNNTLARYVDQELKLAVLARRSDIESTYESHNPHVGKVDLEYFLSNDATKKNNPRHAFVNFVPGAKQMLAGLFKRVLQESTNLDINDVNKVCTANITDNERKIIMDTSAHPDREILHQITLAQIRVLARMARERNTECMIGAMVDVIERTPIEITSRLYTIEDPQKYFKSQIVQLLPESPDVFVTAVYQAFHLFFKCLGFQICSMLFYKPQTTNEDFIRGILCGMNFNHELIEILNMCVVKTRKVVKKK